MAATASQVMPSVNYSTIMAFFDNIDYNSVLEVQKALNAHAWLKANINNPKALLPEAVTTGGPICYKYPDMCFIDARKNSFTARKTPPEELDENGKPKKLPEGVLWFPSAPYPLFRAINTGKPEMVKAVLGGGADPNLMTPYDLCYCLFDGEFSLSHLSGKAFSKANQQEILKQLIMAGYDPSCEHTFKYSNPNRQEITRSFYDILQSKKEDHGFKEAAELAKSIEEWKKLKSSTSASAAVTPTTLSNALDNLVLQNPLFKPTQSAPFGMFNMPTASMPSQFSMLNPTAAMSMFQNAVANPFGGFNTAQMPPLTFTSTATAVSSATSSASATASLAPTSTSVANPPKS